MANINQETRKKIVYPINQKYLPQKKSSYSRLSPGLKTLVHFLHLPPLMRQIDTIQKIINNWARKDSKSLPSATIIQLPKKKGGWNLTNIKAAVKARSAKTSAKLL